MNSYGTTGRGCAVQGVPQKCSDQSARLVLQPVTSYPSPPPEAAAAAAAAHKEVQLCIPSHSFPFCHMPAVAAAAAAAAAPPGLMGSAALDGGFAAPVVELWSKKDDRSDPGTPYSRRHEDHHNESSRSDSCVTAT
eukprot:881432-Pelagomonas_calceolata.AAC.3